VADYDDRWDNSDSHANAILPPHSKKKLEWFQTWPLQSLVLSIVRASPNIFCTVPSFNVYIPQQLQPIANDSGHLPRARSPWVDSKGKICLCSNYSRQLSQAEKHRARTCKTKKHYGRLKWLGMTRHWEGSSGEVVDRRGKDGTQILHSHSILRMGWTRICHPELARQWLALRWAHLPAECHPPVPGMVARSQQITSGQTWHLLIVSGFAGGSFPVVRVMRAMLSGSVRGRALVSALRPLGVWGRVSFVFSPATVMSSFLHHDRRDQPKAWSVRRTQWKCP